MSSAPLPQDVAEIIFFQYLEYRVDRLEAGIEWPGMAMRGLGVYGVNKHPSLEPIFSDK
jgi:hypothetical protein